jgi:hypothetical protein
LSKLHECPVVHDEVLKKNSFSQTTGANHCSQRPLFVHCTGCKLSCQFPYLCRIYAGFNMKIINQVDEKSKKKQASVINGSLSKKSKEQVILLGQL